MPLSDMTGVDDDDDQYSSYHRKGGVDGIDDQYDDNDDVKSNSISMTRIMRATVSIVSAWQQSCERRQQHGNKHVSDGSSTATSMWATAAARQQACGRQQQHGNKHVRDSSSTATSM